MFLIVINLRHGEIQIVVMVYKMIKKLKHWLDLFSDFLIVLISNLLELGIFIVLFLFLTGHHSENCVDMYVMFNCNAVTFHNNEIVVMLIIALIAILLLRQQSQG